MVPRSVVFKYVGLVAYVVGTVLTSSVDAIVKERVYNFDDAGAVAGQLPAAIAPFGRRGTNDIKPSTTDFGGVDPPANVNFSLVPLIGSGNTARIPLYAAAADRPGATATNLALSFDGVDDTLYNPNPASATTPYPFDPRDFNSQFNVLSQAWVKPTSTTFSADQYVYRVGNELGAAVISANGKWAMRIGTTADQYTESTISVQSNVWTHVAVYRGGNNSLLYINGSLAAQDPGFWGGESPDVRLGSDVLAAGGFYRGLVDNFNIGVPSDNRFDPALDLDYFADKGIVFSNIEGDINQDNLVNNADYQIWSQHVGFNNGFGVGDPGTLLLGDANRSGVIDQFDFMIINAASIAMGNGAVGVTVPEPAGVVIGIVACAGLMLALARRRNSLMEGGVKSFVVATALAVVTLLLTSTRSSAVLVVAEDFLYDGASKKLRVGGGFNGFEHYQGGQNGPGGSWDSRWGNLGDGIVVTPEYIPPGEPPVAEPNTPFMVGMLDGDNFGPNSMLIRDFTLASSIATNQTLYFGGRFKADLNIDPVPQFYAPRLYLNRIRGADNSSAGEPRDGSDDIAIGFQENSVVARLGNNSPTQPANFGFEAMTTVASNPPDNGAWHFIIGKLELNIGGGVNERLTVWVNPTGVETGGTTVQLERDILTSLSELQGTFDAQATNKTDPADPEMGRTYIDDLAIGTTWQDVATVSVPRLKLQINRATNSAKIINSTNTSFALTSYSIESDSGSLSSTGWNSLDDQNVGNWQENLATAQRVLESKLGGSLTVAPNSEVSLGTLFNPAGAEDLTGRYSTLDGLLNVMPVEYVTIVGVNGDYNNNGVVDAADYTLWRDNLGTSFQLQNEGGISPGIVDAADYTFWRSRFGATSSLVAAGSNTVPEVTSMTCVVLMSAVVAIHQRRKNTADNSR